MNDFRQFVEDNPKLVNRRESKSHPGLYVLKYNRKVFFDNLWNDHLEKCRGLVMDKDWNIVAHPFTKIYNYGENGASMAMDDVVDAVVKVNGFMAAVTNYNDELLVSTTGSLDSDFVQLAKDKLKLSDQPFRKGMTYIFEIVHEDDPHIIMEEPGAYLIGVRDLTGRIIRGPMVSETGLDMWARALGYARPQVYKDVTFFAVTDAVKTVAHEGFVIRRKSDDYTIKIKSPQYLSRKAIMRKKDILSLDKSRVDEEYYDLLDHIRTNAVTFNLLSEQERLHYIVNYFG